MAYDEQLAERIREFFRGREGLLEEKRMMGGLTFMLNDKMCVGILKNDLLCRIDPTLHDEATSKTGCRTMDFTKRPMSGFILVDETGMSSQKDFEYWMNMALDFNPRATSSKRKSN